MVSTIASRALACFVLQLLELLFICTAVICRGMRHVSGPPVSLWGSGAVGPNHFSAIQWRAHDTRLYCHCHCRWIELLLPWAWNREWHSPRARSLLGFSFWSFGQRKQGFLFLQVCLCSWQICVTGLSGTQSGIYGR